MARSLAKPAMVAMLTRRIKALHLLAYAIDIVCDADVVPFYERLGLVNTNAMSLRLETTSIPRA